MKAVIVSQHQPGKVGIKRISLRTSQADEALVGVYVAAPPGEFDVNIVKTMLDGMEAIGNMVGARQVDKSNAILEEMTNSRIQGRVIIEFRLSQSVAQPLAEEFDV